MQITNAIKAMFGVIYSIMGGGKVDFHDASTVGYTSDTETTENQRISRRNFSSRESTPDNTISQSY